MSGKVTCPQAVSRESHRTRNKNKQTNTCRLMARGAFGGVLVQLRARPRSRSMLVEVSGPSGTASNTLRPKRLPIHIGSAGVRREGPSSRPELLRTRPNEPNRTEPRQLETKTKGDTARSLRADSHTHTDTHKYAPGTTLSTRSQNTCL
jgi:hypothetical protein